MEMIVKCPDCGKDLKITVEEANKKPQKVMLTQRIEQLSSWGEIAERVHADSRDFCVGDEVSTTFDDGTKATFVVAAINPYADNEVAFVLKDCLPDRYAMNEACTNEGGWKESDMREHLRSDVYNLLPSDLQEVIKKRKIKQNLNGEMVECEDAIWLLSKKEATGKDADSDVDDVHFELFKDERSRVKQINGETVWYFLRSPLTSNGSAFWVVSTSGSGSTSGASYSYGVAFGFLI